MSENAQNLIQYMLQWDVSSFFHISIDSMLSVGLFYFTSLLGVKLGWGILRDALNI